MKEIGFDLSNKRPDSVFEFFKQGRLYDYVITVCDVSTEGKCPVFPGVRKRLHWPFPDPPQPKGTHQDKLDETRKIRDQIKSRIESWVKEFT
jgi:arsenate reductase